MLGEVAVFVRRSAYTSGRVRSGSGAADLARKLDKRQLEFARLVADGYQQTKAAEMVGYSFPAQSAHQLMRNPRVLAHLRERRNAVIQGDMSTLALETMRHLMREGPAAQRFQAARWTLENAGHQGAVADQAQDKPLDEMNADELSQAIQHGMSALQELAGQLHGHHVIDGNVREVRDVTPETEEPALELPPDDDFLQ